jgi:hypothetical protein
MSYLNVYHSVFVFGKPPNTNLDTAYNFIKVNFDTAFILVLLWFVMMCHLWADMWIFFSFWGGVEMSPLLLLLPVWDDDGCGAVGVTRFGRGNGSTRRKPALVQLCPPQIAHIQTWDQTGHCSGKSATNHLSYGTANMQTFSTLRNK